MLTDMQLVFIILLVTTICFLIPAFRPDLVALSSLLTLKLTGLLTVEETFAGFSNSVVVMIAALFIVGEGVFQTGLAEQAGKMLVKWSGTSEFRLTIFMMVLVAFLSAFLSNTGTVAILLPVVIILSRRMQLHPGKLLMPLAFASSMGGTLSLIGTAPNLLARQTLLDYGYGGLSFFAFTPVGLVILLVGTAYLWFLGRRWLDKPVEKEIRDRRPGTFNSTELLEQYQVSPYIHALQVPAKNEAIGKTLKELRWPGTYELTVLEVIRNGLLRFPRGRNVVSRRFLAGPNYMVRGGDILIVFAEGESLQKFLEETDIQMVKPSFPGQYYPESSHLAEVILTPYSRLNNYTLPDIHFRDKYSLTVLAIKHQYREARRPAPEERIVYGDALLVHGKWKDIDLLAQEKSDLVVLRHGAEHAVSYERGPRPVFAAVIVSAMLLLMVLEWLPVVVTAVLAAMFMLFTGCVKNMEQAYRSVNWQTIVLIAAMLPMATALEKTGGVAFMSASLIAALGTIGPVAVLAGLYLVASVFSQFISNTATAVLLYPVAIMAAQKSGVSPIPMVMAVAFSASMAFATPVATPPNAMVMAAGKYSFFDFMRVGIPMQLIIASVAVLLLPLFFPF